MCLFLLYQSNVFIPTVSVSYTCVLFLLYQYNMCLFLLYQYNMCLFLLYQCNMCLFLLYQCNMCLFLLCHCNVFISTDVFVSWVYWPIPAGCSFLHVCMQGKRPVIVLAGVRAAGSNASDVSDHQKLVQLVENRVKSRIQGIADSIMAEYTEGYIK